MKRSMVRGSICLAVAAAFVVAGLCCSGEGHAAAKGESPWADLANAKARLISATLDKDGVPVRYTAVQLRMDQGWKTYWRNPGDSGVPPAFDWSGSKNVKRAEVLYPAPHRFADANGTAVGYYGDVIFPVELTPEQPGKPIELSVTFDFGVCKDLCVPNSAELTATVPPGFGKGDAIRISQALEQVPVKAGADTLPRIEAISVATEGDLPGLIVDAVFANAATNTDLFVSSTEVLVPVPKALGPLKEGRQRFSVTFMTKEEAQAIKGKPLRFTLVSDQGSSETVKKVP